jgi:hypothetical protein
VMGIKIEALYDRPPGDDGAKLVDIKVTLICEGGHVPNLLCIGNAEFIYPGGFIEAHHEAIKAGWLERETENGRTWVCPECSGKLKGGK